MKFGCFGTSAHLEEIAAAGFDTAELDATELVSMSHADFHAFVRRAEKSGLSFEVFSGLLPLSVRLHDPAFDEKRWLAHVEQAAQRISALGAEMIPFGAGKCRSIPGDAPDRLAAQARVASFVCAICDIMAKKRITVVVEPLGPANSNYLNFLGETAQFTRSLQRNNCAIMCDMRHMVSLREAFDQIPAYRGDIRHAHIDYPIGNLRLFPNAQDGYHYQPYFDAIFAAGYDAVLTIEATAYQHFSSEAAQGLSLLRSCAKQAGWPL